MSGWATRHDGFVGPAQLQRLAPPPTRDFRRPPDLPPPQPIPLPQPIPSASLSSGSPASAKGGKSRNSFFAAFRNIGNVQPPINTSAMEVRQRRASEVGPQTPPALGAAGGGGLGGREISAPQRLQPRHGSTLPSSGSAPALSNCPPPGQQGQLAQIGEQGQGRGQPRSGTERTTSSSRQASGALSDHGHGAAGSAALPGGGYGPSPGYAGENGHTLANGGGSPGGTITAGSFAHLREREGEQRRASMVDLPLPSSGSAPGGPEALSQTHSHEGGRLSTVQESPRSGFERISGGRGVGGAGAGSQEGSREGGGGRMSLVHTAGGGSQEGSRLSQVHGSQEGSRLSGVGQHPPPQQQQQQQQQQGRGAGSQEGGSRLSQVGQQPSQPPQQQAQPPQAPNDRGSLDVSTSSSSAHFTPTPPLGGPLSSLHPELRSGISLSIAHAHKVYFSGPLSRRLELEPSGRPPHRQEGWVDVWAQLGGTTLSVWEMKAIEEASRKGEEVPPSYVNVTDAFIGVLGSIEIPPTGDQPASKRTNILTLNTAGSNLLLFSAPSGQALVSWAAALRLATWEKSRLEEIYTGHLLRMSLTTPGGEFKQPKTALTRGKLEGWVRIRLAGQVDWKRVYAIITSAYDPLQSPNLPGTGKPSAPAFAAAIGHHPQHSALQASASTRPESPTKSPTVLTKRRMSGIFRSSGPTGSQNGGHNSAGLFAHHKHPLVDGVPPPVIAFHAAPPQGRKPKPPLLTLTHVTQAFALYPERPEMISKSNLFKIEALLGQEVDHSLPAPPAPSGKKSKTLDHPKFAGKMAGREGWCIVQPELAEEPGQQKASLVMDMLKWLVAVHDAFGLYGRPAGYTWDPRDPGSMMFSYPVGPMRDHLFLDRELAEALDPNDDSTSSVRARLLNILLERMRGPPAGASVSGHSQTIEEETETESHSTESEHREQEAPQLPVPELPPLEFGTAGYDNGYPSGLDSLSRGIGAPPTSYGLNQGGVRRSHSVLTKITEQSTVRGDSGDTERGPGSVDGPDRERSLSRRSAFSQDLDSDGEPIIREEDMDEDESGGDHTVHEDHTIHAGPAGDRESSSSEPTVIAGASMVHSPEMVEGNPSIPAVQPPASPYAVAHAEVRAASPYAGSAHSGQRSQRSGSPYALPPVGAAPRAGSPFAQAPRAASPFAQAPRAASPLAQGRAASPYAVGQAPRAASPYAVPPIGAVSAPRAASPYAAPGAPTPSTARPASPYTIPPRMVAAARAASPFAVASTAGETPYQTAPLTRTISAGQEPKDYGFPPSAEGHKPTEAAIAAGQSMISPRIQPLPSSPSPPGLSAPSQESRSVSPLAPPKRVSTTPPPQSPKLRSPTFEPPKIVHSPLGPPPTAPGLSPAILGGPPPLAQHRMTPDKLPFLQTSNLRTALPAPPPVQQPVALPEYPAETPFTDSPMGSDSLEHTASPLPTSYQPIFVPTLGSLPLSGPLDITHSYAHSQPGTGRSSPASQYPPTEVGTTPAAVEELPTEEGITKPFAGVSAPPFRRQQTPIAFDRIPPPAGSSGPITGGTGLPTSSAAQGSLGTAGAEAKSISGSVLMSSTEGGVMGGRQNGLGRKPSGARALPIRPPGRSTSVSPVPPHPQAQQAQAQLPAAVIPQQQTITSTPLGTASTGQALPPAYDQPPPAQQQHRAEPMAMARPLPVARQQPTRDSLGDFGDDALAALSYMQLDGTGAPRAVPREIVDQAQQQQQQQRSPPPQTSPPRTAPTAATTTRSPPPAQPQPQSPQKEDQVVFPSSFAPTKQAAERKAKIQEQQQRHHEAVHKPGRPTLEQRLQAAAKGNWDRSSSEEEEDEEEDDEASEEDELPDRGRQAQVRPPPRDISLPSSTIHAPLPQPVNTPSHRFEIEAPSPPQQARMGMLPPDAGLRQSTYSMGPSAGGPVPGPPRGMSPGRAMGMGVPVAGPDVDVDQGTYMPGGPAYDQQQQPQQQARMRASGYPFPPVEEPRPQSQPRSRDRYDSRERPPTMALPTRQSVWTANLERDDAMPMVPPNNGGRDTFISLEPNETMTKAFTPHGLLQAGIQEKHDRSAKRQEEIARETGASLINVPSKPPPPQTGLLGAITAHERERNREGGMGATLTEREREKRLAEERQRRLDEYQRQQLDQAEQAMGQGGQFDMYGNPGFGGYNPMAGGQGMLHPMMTGMGGMGGMMGNPMMMGGYGMNPMMYGGMGGMMPFNGMGGGGWGGAPGITPQQQQMAAQAAMDAYNRTMMAYSQVGSQPQSPAASETGMPSGAPNGGGGLNQSASNATLNRMSTASPPMMSPGGWGMQGMGGMGMGGMGMPGMGMMGMMSPQMMGMMGMPGGGMGGMGSMSNMGGMSPMATGMSGMGGMGNMGMGGMGMGMPGMQSMSNLSGMNSPAFNAQPQPGASPAQGSTLGAGGTPDYLAARNRYSSFTASERPQSRELSGENTPARSGGANTPNHPQA